jgi:hypothetical protein
VLEAWDKLEGVPVSGASVSSAPVSGVSLDSEKSPEKILPVDLTEAKQSAALAPARQEPEAVEEAPIQPMLSDFGLYKCQICGKMVMGYEK